MSTHFASDAKHARLLNWFPDTSGRFHETRKGERRLVICVAVRALAPGLDISYSGHPLLLSSDLHNSSSFGVVLEVEALQLHKLVETEST